MRGLNALGRGDKDDLVRIFGDLQFYGVDQLERAARVLALVDDGLNPDGEKLRAQVAFVDGVEIEVAAVERIAEIEVVIDEALRRVSVRINNDGRLFDFGRGDFLWG